MLGLFLIVPVFSLLAREVEGQTPLLIGLAIGVYGLAQALLLQAIALIALIVSGSMPLVFVALGLYFISFNLQEALFPAQVSILASTGKRGKVMGRYTTFQFLGSFAGGMLGGVLLGWAGYEAALWFLAMLTCVWFAGLFAYSKRLKTRV
ncbi:MAG: hypothetical protein L3J24_13890 [Xanthomonadales bacterium]|nr:hypothetical protein [Xanthomonadales bacterium]